MECFIFLEHYQLMFVLKATYHIFLLILQNGRLLQYLHVEQRYAEISFIVKTISEFLLSSSSAA